jgi:tetratricopeptide (TPR) repeat protein
MSAAVAMAQAPKESEKPASPAAKLPPWQRVLKGNDARMVATLEKQIAELEQKGQVANAATPAGEALSIRRRVQGEEHWETVDARIKQQRCLRVSALSREDRSELAMAVRESETAEELCNRGRYAEAEPLQRKVLAIHRRILGEDYPGTASCSYNLSVSLTSQGRYAEAQQLCERALAIWIEALGGHHPLTAQGHNDLAVNLARQGRYGEALPMCERALAIWREVWGEDHALTAYGYNNEASNLDAQGRHAEARPLHQRAL